MASGLLAKVGWGTVFGLMGAQLLVGTGVFLAVALEATGRYEFPLIPSTFEGGVMLFIGVVFVGISLSVPVLLIALGLVWIGSE